MTRRDWLWVERRAAELYASRWDVVVYSLTAAERYGFVWHDSTHNWVDIPRNRAEWAGYLYAVMTAL